MHPLQIPAEYFWGGVSAAIAGLFFIVKTSFQVGTMFKTHQLDRKRLRKLVRGHRRHGVRITGCENEIKELKAEPA
jgi:hypothetical protein